mmetsp:Transcript_53436/g.158174  ORF Transcript_53436/g.158174 Transcript_53436/m.158174 type:complete len:116 (-) Transcript_53436:10-357(-)
MMTAPQPSLVAWSAPVTESLGLAAEECETDAFLRTFRQLALDRWATAYDVSFTCKYGGQRGDDRVISNGQCAGHARRSLADIVLAPGRHIGTARNDAHDLPTRRGRRSRALGRAG